MTAKSTVQTIVHLDEQPSISEFMAAGLTAATIQHILFLKNQIPFPVAQLGRLPIPPNSKSSKKRVDLLDAVDALSCHLHSTFSALSSSLALSSLKYPHRSEHAQVHLLILLGPSLFRPRSRIILTIDGLKTQACNRETEIGGSAHSEDENQCYNTGSTLNRVRRLDHARLPLSSLPPPASDPGRENDPSSPKHTENDTSSDPKNSPDPPSPLDETFTAYLEEQRILSAAERLLSRSLAIACAEDGVTLNAELEPTQTHVLIQAPRGFHHPSWTPRQNMSPGLDSVLTGLRSHKGITKKERAGVKTDEIVIHCDYPKVSVDTEGLENVEDGDLIWWSWDGKIVGFGDP